MTIILFCIIVYCSIHILMWNKDNKEIKSMNEEILNDVITTIDNEKHIDFDKLLKKNKDTVGWIEVKGTNINYPIVQTDNNDYYLTHTFNRKKNNAGSIFMDYRNNIDDLDKNTIIYGHARLDKSMFGSLKNTITKKWYKNTDNHIIKLTTKDKETYWQTFSTYHIKTEDYYITTNFDNDNEYKKFINTLIKRSVYDYNVEVNTNDYILTLSSCYRNSEKIVLHAKLIKED